MRTLLLPMISGKRTNSISVLGMCLDPLNPTEACSQVLAWAAKAESRFICHANVHMTMEAWDASTLQAVFNSSDLTLPDGMPLVWGLKLLGAKQARQVRGGDLMLLVCERAAAAGVPVALYGGRGEYADDLACFLRSTYPDLRLACFIVPPFRPVTEEEDASYVRELNDSGARIVFVGLGCPKQELWMAEHRGKVNAVMIGVGAAFDFFAGRTKQAPVWMQRGGLEWLFRLLSEPRRLWKRYLKHNPRFVLLFTLQWFARFLGVQLFRPN